MSYCKEEGKDKVIFVTKEDHDKPSTTQLDDYYEGEPGLILDNGEINWNCPCLGGMATGPCGYEFRSAFTCFHNSTSEPKGSDCYEEFRGMQDCMVNHPTVYDTAGEDKDDDEIDVFGAGTESEAGSSVDSEPQENKSDNSSNIDTDTKGSSDSKQGR